MRDPLENFVSASTGAASRPRPAKRGWTSLPSAVLVRSLDALIWLYQKTLSPALVVALPSCGCRFAPTCSHYARQALREHGLRRGLALAVFRLVRCGPWHPGGLDPVPPRRCVSIVRGTSVSSRSLRQS